jgi:hypothetical protein
LECTEAGADSSIVAVHTLQLVAGNNRLVVELVDNTLVDNSIQKRKKLES